MLPEPAGVHNPLRLVGTERARSRFADALRRAGFDLLDPSADDGALVVVADGPDFAARVDEVAAANAGRHALIAVEVPPDRLAEAIARGADEAVARGASEEEIVARVRLATERIRGPAGSRLTRGELAALLEITEAATSHLELDDLLRVVVDKIAQVVPSDRCSAILIEDDVHALVMASHEAPDLRRLRIEVDRYPEVRAAVESREPVVIDDMHNHPLMAEVRDFVSRLPVSSLVVAPLVAQGDAYGALLLRLARNRAFGEREQAFVRAASHAVANSVRNARLHTSVRQKRDELEAAYQQRYQELVRLNDQLKESNRIKDELLAICSHDLRSPLNTLLGHARLLQTVDLPDRARRSAEAIERQGNRILELVQQILERGRNRAVAAGSEPVDLAAMARTLAQDAVTERGIRVVAAGDRSATVEGDASALRQVLENFVANAVAHSPDGATVEVDVRLAGNADHVRVEVRDRGPGIPEAELPLVFERYRKSADSRGLGLGLAICRDVVEQHGGSIWAQAREGGGTTFVFTVPTRTGERRHPALLAVCADPAVCSDLAAALEPGRLAIARTLDEGVRQATLLLPEAILVSEEFPAAADALRAIPGLGEVPILYLGAAPAEVFRALPLPIAPDALRAALADLAAGRTA